jgi:hypothetical protein
MVATNGQVVANPAREPRRDKATKKSERQSLNLCLAFFVPSGLGGFPSGYNDAMPTSAADSTSGTPSPTARPRHRWYQFTLRTAGVWMVLLCLLLGSFAWWRDRAERQRKVVEEMRDLATAFFEPVGKTRRDEVRGE